MTNKELVEKRVVPALQQMYKEADNWYTTSNNKVSITWEEINKTIKHIKDENPDYSARFVLDCFYIDENRQEEILKKATARLRQYWRWPYKSQIVYNDSQIKEMKQRLAELKEKFGKDSFEYQDLKEKISNNDKYKRQDELWNDYYNSLSKLNDKLNKKEITRKEYNKKEEELAKSYNCTKRSREAEAVYFEIWNYAPTASKEKFEAYRQYWRDLCSIKEFKTKDNIRKLVEELFYKKRGIDTKNITNNEAQELDKIQDYMKNAFVFIENYYKLYDEQTNR